MYWEKKNDHYLESESGFRITKSFLRKKPVYLAFAPKENITDKRKAHYNRGEQVPSERQLIGRYNEAKAAQQRCEKTAGKKRGIA